MITILSIISVILIVCNYFELDPREPEVSDWKLILKLVGSCIPIVHLFIIVHEIHTYRIRQT